MDETGRRFEIEVTPEMIEAGGDVIAQHMTDWEVCRISDDPCDGYLLLFRDRLKRRVQL